MRATPQRATGRSNAASPPQAPAPTAPRLPSADVILQLFAGRGLAM